MQWQWRPKRYANTARRYARHWLWFPKSWTASYFLRNNHSNHRILFSLIVIMTLIMSCGFLEGIARLSNLQRAFRPCLVRVFNLKRKAAIIKFPFAVQLVASKCSGPDLHILHDLDDNLRFRFWVPCNATATLILRNGSWNFSNPVSLTTWCT